MLKSVLGAIVAASLFGAVACTQGPNEEAGENADNAAEQAATGDTNLGQGPAEEVGEQIDETTEGAPVTPPPATP